MNPLDSMLAGVRARPETPSARSQGDGAAREDTDSAFEAILGTLDETKKGEPGPHANLDPSGMPSELDGSASSAVDGSAQPSPHAPSDIFDALIAPALTGSEAANGAAQGIALPRASTPGSLDRAMEALLAQAVPGVASKRSEHPTASAGALSGRSAEAAPQAGPATKIAVLSQETHFAPVLPTVQAEKTASGSPAVQAMALTGFGVGSLNGAGKAGRQESAATAMPIKGQADESPLFGTSDGFTSVEAGSTVKGSTNPLDTNGMRMPTPRSSDGSGDKWAHDLHAAFSAQPAPVQSQAMLARGDAAEGQLSTLSAARSALSPRSDTGAAESAPDLSAQAGPLPEAAPMRQVADTVAAEVLKLDSPSAVLGQPRPLGQHGPLRLLTIQLRPDDLGSVLVRMRLQDGRLEMSLQASREETAELLRKDSAALSEVLRSAGYQPDLLTIQSGGSEGTQTNLSGRGSGAAFSGLAGGQGQGGSSSDQSDRHSLSTPESERSRAREQDHEDRSLDRDRAGLYL